MEVESRKSEVGTPGLDAGERDFLVSLARNELKWDLRGIAHLEQMLGIRWKLENLGRLAK